MTEVVYALLEGATALEILKEAGQEALSANPVVRGIIDNQIGYVSLAKLQPQDGIEEAIIRLETPNLKHATEILAALPGVKETALNFEVLRPRQEVPLQRSVFQPARS